MDISDVVVYTYFLILSAAIVVVAVFFGLGYWWSLSIGLAGGWLGMMLTVWILATSETWFARKNKK